VKGVTEMLAKRDAAGAAARLAQAARVIDKAVTKGVIHRNNASRKVARLAKQLHRLQHGTTS
jgi:small subunit ribosomal protein S20